MGTKRKFWYFDGEKRMLFKAEERGTGEDWAEKIACELCRLLGLPHVHYELAHDETAAIPGVICESCAPRPRTLLLGNQIMLARDPDYPAGGGNRYKVREHTVGAVEAAVRTLRPPPAPWNRGASPGASALDIFAGYVMLDAWIANQDRHHENWGALREGTTLSLAPTFDHGASMARNLTDEDRYARITTRDRKRQVGAFARRARSAFYAGAAAETKPLTTLGAWRAFASLVPHAAGVWLERLDAVDSAAVDALLERVPPSRMTNICRDFTRRLLEENRRGLLTGEDQ